MVKSIYHQGDYCHIVSPYAPRCWVCDGLKGSCPCETKEEEKDQDQQPE